MNPKVERPLEDENPFEKLKIGDWEVLDKIEGRSLCKICGKSRKYFCYTCYIPVTELEGNIPRIKLPIKIDIIKHAREIDGKSTAAHAAVLAPEDVKVSTYPFIPEYGADERVVLIYPGKDATTIDSLFSPRDDGESETVYGTTHLPITRAVFIDSTWNQSKGIYKDPRLRALPCVVLQSRLSQFWRHQKGSPRWYLATIEAIHQLLVELHVAAVMTALPLGLDGEATRLGPYDGQYDSLLFFFRYMYSKIHKLYDHNDLLSYKRRLK